MVSKTRLRLGAVLLGVLLAASFVAGSLYWNDSYVSGIEPCDQCGIQRSVDRRGPVWFVSEPYESKLAARPDWLPVDCVQHQWQRTGCWREDGGYAYLGPVRSRLARRAPLRAGAVGPATLPG